MKYLVALSLIGLLLFASCGSSGQEGIFDHPVVVGIDSDNNRLFVIENNGVLFILNATSRDGIGDQPVVNKKREAAIHDLLPSAPTDLIVASLGDTSRLFIAGGQKNDDGETVTNQILVLDFDGATLSEGSFSPIVVDDGDDATSESDNTLGGLEVDSDNARLYVTDSTAGMLYGFDLDDGTAAMAPIAVPGNPNRMSLDGNRLYVANATATEADQVITVVNTDDFSTTAIDLDIPTADVTVLSTGAGTVMMARDADLPRVLVRTVDTTTFADSDPIAAGDDSVADGVMNSGNGIASGIGRILLVTNTSGTLFGYIPQADGNITVASFADDLTSFTAALNSTATDVLEDIDLLTNDDGEGVTVYITATGSGDLVFSDVGTDDFNARF